MWSSKARTCELVPQCQMIWHKNIHASIFIQMEGVIFENTYVRTCIQTMKMNEKRDPEFEGAQGRIYRRVWREEREGKFNDIII